MWCDRATTKSVSAAAAFHTTPPHTVEATFFPPVGGKVLCGYGNYCQPRGMWKIPTVREEYNASTILHDLRLRELWKLVFGAVWSICRMVSYCSEECRKNNKGSQDEIRRCSMKASSKIRSTKASIQLFLCLPSFQTAKHRPQHYLRLHTTNNQHEKSYEKHTTRIRWRVNFSFHCRLLRLLFVFLIYPRERMSVYTCTINIVLLILDAMRYYYYL